MLLVDAEGVDGSHLHVMYIYLYKTNREYQDSAESPIYQQRPCQEFIHIYIDQQLDPDY